MAKEEERLIALEKIVNLVDRIDVDNHDYEELEDLYDSLCEIIQNVKHYDTV